MIGIINSVQVAPLNVGAGPVPGTGYLEEWKDGGLVSQGSVVLNNRILLMQ